jgi:hypothetical protein
MNPHESLRQDPPKRSEMMACQIEDMMAVLVPLLLEKSSVKQREVSALLIYQSRLKTSTSNSRVMVGRRNVSWVGLVQVPKFSEVLNNIH